MVKPYFVVSVDVFHALDQHVDLRNDLEELRLKGRGLLIKTRNDLLYPRIHNIITIGLSFI